MVNLCRKKYRLTVFKRHVELHCSFDSEEEYREYTEEYIGLESEVERDSEFSLAA